MPSGTVTWNPADKAAIITLSGSNLVASASTFSSRHMVRANWYRQQSAGGKWYFEISLTGQFANAGLAFTVGANGSMTGGQTFALGANDGDHGLYYDSTRYKKLFNGAVANSDLASFSPPVTIMVAVDLAAPKLWLGVNGTWLEGGNPAAGTGELSTYMFSAFGYTPSWSSGNLGASSGTLRAKSSSFAFAPPSGFAPWEDPPQAATIAAIETRDSAAITAIVPLLASIAVAESTDTATLSGQGLTGCHIAAAEGADRVAINKPAPGAAFVRRRFGVLLYEPLPLRKSGALGNFADEFVLAHRYGDLTSGRFKLRRLTDTKFFAADHPMAIAEVFIDAQRTASWASRLESDSAGNTWTVVEFTAPVPPEAAVSATGTGKRNPRTGALIENPADIAENVMRIAGRNDPWWDQLRAESAAAGLRLAGSIEEAKSTRATLDEVLGSAGAIWAPGMARLYPVVEVSGYIGKLDAMRVENLTVRATLDNTADVLRLYYDPDKAGARSQHYIELTANPAAFGGSLAANRSFDWLRTPANAESVARRLLPWLAGERYEVGFDYGGDDSLRAGQWRELAGHPQWPFPDAADPIIMVTRVTPRPQSGSAQCLGYTLISAPACEVTAHSIALPTTRDAGVELAVKDGVATLTVLDANDKPIFNALVGLDGGAPKKTDASGLVSFTAKKGEHRLAIQAPGKVANVLTITL